jgi:hypothetical protein
MPDKRATVHPSILSFEGDIKKVVNENSFFRNAVYMDEHSQLMLMSTCESSESGEEKREDAAKILSVGGDKAKIKERKDADHAK